MLPQVVETDPWLLLFHSAALDEQQRKDSKAKNTNGNPIQIGSKILAVHLDPCNQGSVYIAQSSGVVRRVKLEVSDINHIYLSHERVTHSACP